MSRSATVVLIDAYYSAFNAGDMDAFLGCLAEDVRHVINQGGEEVGKAAFVAFMAKMNTCYREQLREIEIFASESGARAAAEFVVHGEYLQTDEGLPPASGQKYVLPAGAFFEVRDGLITRVTNFYNLQDWLHQIAGG